MVKNFRRKESDIYSKPSTNEFLKALRPEADEELSRGQKKLRKIWQEQIILDHLPTRFL